MKLVVRVSANLGESYVGGVETSAWFELPDEFLNIETQFPMAVATAVDSMVDSALCQLRVRRAEELVSQLEK